MKGAIPKMAEDDQPGPEPKRQPGPARLELPVQPALPAQPGHGRMLQLVLAQLELPELPDRPVQSLSM